MDFQDEMVKLRDDVLESLRADGLVFAAESAVFACSEARTGANVDAGNPGTVTVTRVEMVPRPLASLRERWTNTPNGTRYKVADATLRVSRQFSAAYLKGVSYFEIDGALFDLVAGGLRKRGLIWEAMLKRREVA